jgi:hypothetical protein
MGKKIFPGLLLTFIAVPAFASIPEFTEIDTDQDGSLSRIEAEEAGISQQLFALLDFDKDEKLSADEYNILTAGQI